MIVTGLVACGLFSPTGYGASFFVTTTDDVIDAGDGLLSLREAMIAANESPGAHDINIPAGYYEFQISGRNENKSWRGDLDYTNTTGKLVINGAGPANTIISANGRDRVFQFFAGTVVDLNAMTIREGLANPGVQLGDDGDDGGGIWSAAELRLNECYLKDNRSGSGQGGYFDYDTMEWWFPFGGDAGDGGGVFNSGTLIVNRCRFERNLGNYGGSALLSGRTGRGGGIYNALNTTAFIDRSVFVSNMTYVTAYVSGGGHGGGVYSRGTTYISSSLFHGHNEVKANGSAIYQSDGVLHLINSTIADGTNTDVYIHTSTQTSRVEHCTFSDPAPLYGQDFVRVKNSVFDHDLSTFSRVYSEGYNMFPSTNFNLTGPQTGDLIGLDPMLGPLQDNGGYSHSHALLPGSPAIDAGDPLFVNPPLYDQREFVRVNGAGIDIGAYEAVVASNTFDLIVYKTGPATVATNAVMEYIITVTNYGPADAAGVVVTDTLPASVTFVSASPGCVFSNQQVICLSGLLPSGTSVSFDVFVRAPPTPWVTLTNRVTGSGGPNEPYRGNNIALVETWVEAIDLALDITAPPEVFTNMLFDYTITITNRAAGSASGVTVTNVLPNSVSFVSGPPGCVVSNQLVICSLGTLAGVWFDDVRIDRAFR